MIIWFMHVIKTKFLLKRDIYNLADIITKACITKKAVFTFILLIPLYPNHNLTPFLGENSINLYPSMILKKSKHHMNKTV